MKKHSGILSALLAVIMAFSAFAAPVLALGAEEISVNAESTAAAPTLNIKKVSETPETLVIDIELVSGSFLCFDAQVSAAARLVCKSIEFSPDYKAFTASIPEPDLGVNMFNVNSGKFSVAGTVSCSNPMSIATYTYSTSPGAGVTKAEISLAVDSCYIESADGDTEVQAAVTSSLGETHTHVQNENWIVTKEPTCLEEGSRQTVCPECGEVIQTKPIAKLQHDTEEIRVEPSCEEPGYTETVCKTCKTVLSHTDIPALGHDTYEVRLEPTCHSEGSVDVVCRRCEKVISHTTLQKTEHKLVTEMKEADCHNKGYIIIKCALCGDVASRVDIAKTEHNWTDWTVVKTPTYTSDGLKRRVCRICGDVQEVVIPAIKVVPESITLSEKEITLNRGKTTQLFADVQPMEATYSYDVEWSSSNPKVCSVDSEGNVTAHRSGTAVITASADNGKVKAECTVHVDSLFMKIVRIVLGWFGIKI